MKNMFVTALKRAHELPEANDGAAMLTSVKSPIMPFLNTDALGDEA